MLTQKKTFHMCSHNSVFGAYSSNYESIKPSQLIKMYCCCCCFCFYNDLHWNLHFYNKMLHIIYEHAYLHKINLLYVPHSFAKTTTRQKIAVTYKLSLRDLPLCIVKFEKRKKKFYDGKLQNMNVSIMKREKRFMKASMIYIVYGWDASPWKQFLTSWKFSLWAL